MSSGGLAQIRDTLNQGIMRGVMPLKDQIDPFLDQIIRNGNTEIQVMYEVLVSVMV